MFGAPSTVTTDRGGQFVVRRVDEVVRNYADPNHRLSSGSFERFHVNSVKHRTFPVADASYPFNRKGRLIIEGFAANCMILCGDSNGFAYPQSCQGTTHSYKRSPHVPRMFLLG